MVDDSLLTQPATACNTAIKACTLINDDVSPATVQDLMYSLNLIDGEYNPTDQLGKIDLLNNPQLLQWLGEAALCRDAMNFNHEMMLQSLLMLNDCELGSGDERQCCDAKEHCYQNIIDFGKRYEQAYLNILNYIRNN